MKYIIFYKSKTGNSKRYAEFLKTRISGDMFDISKISNSLIKEYDSIFFVSSIKGNKISKIKKFLKYYKHMKNKDVFIMANGISTIQPDSDLRDTLIDMNELFDKHIRFYLLPGGFNFKLLNKFEQMIFKQIANMNKKDSNGSLNMLLTTPIDMVTPQNLDKIVSVVHKIEFEKDK